MESEKVMVTMDDVAYDSKPTMDDTKLIKWRLKDLKYQRLLEIQELGDLLCHGHTFYPAVFNGNSVSGKDWVQQQIFALDIDDGLTMDEADMKLKELGIPQNFMYTSFSSTQVHQKFRIVFCAKDVITDKDYRDRIQRILMGLIPECDPKCKDCARIFFGGKEGKVHHADYEVRFDPEELVARYSDREYVPVRTSRKKRTESHKKVKEKKKKTSTKTKRPTKERKTDPWDVKKAMEAMKGYTNEEPWGKGLYICNAKTYANAVKRYFTECGATYSEGDGRENALFCFYCLMRGFEKLIPSYIATVGLNRSFNEPLGLRELLNIVDSVENKTAEWPYIRYINRGYCFPNAGTVVDFCDIKEPEKYGLAVNEAKRRRKAERKRLIKKVESRLLVLTTDPTQTFEKMLTTLEQEELKISVTTLKSRLKALGINWREKKKALREAEEEFIEERE